MGDNVNHSHDFSLEKVPEGSKRGFWSLLVVMLGFTFFSASMWAGYSIPPWSLYFVPKTRIMLATAIAPKIKQKIG